MLRRLGAQSYRTVSVSTSTENTESSLQDWKRLVWKQEIQRLWLRRRPRGFMRGQERSYREVGHQSSRRLPLEAGARLYSRVSLGSQTPACTVFPVVKLASVGLRGCVQSVAQETTPEINMTKSKTKTTRAVKCKRGRWWMSSGWRLVHTAVIQSQ